MANPVREDLLRTSWINPYGCRSRCWIGAALNFGELRKRDCLKKAGGRLKCGCRWPRTARKASPLPLCSLVGPLLRVEKDFSDSLKRKSNFGEFFFYALRAH